MKKLLFLSVLLMFISIGFSPIRADNPVKSTTVTVTDQAVVPQVPVVVVKDSIVPSSIIDLAKAPPVDPTGFLGIGFPRLLFVLWALITMVVYFVPTANRWTWLSWPIRILELILPNMTKEDGTITAHKTTIWQIIAALFKK